MLGGGFRSRVVEEGEGGPEVPSFCILKVLEGAAARTEGLVFPPPLPADDTVRDAWAPLASRNPPGRWHCGAAAPVGAQGPCRQSRGRERERECEAAGSEDGRVCSPSPPAPGLCVRSSQCLCRAPPLSQLLELVSFRLMNCSLREKVREKQARSSRGFLQTRRCLPFSAMRKGFAVCTGDSWHKNLCFLNFEKLWLMCLSSYLPRCEGERKDFVSCRVCSQVGLKTPASS